MSFKMSLKLVCLSTQCEQEKHFEWQWSLDRASKDAELEFPIGLLLCMQLLRTIANGPGPKVHELDLPMLISISAAICSPSDTYSSFIPSHSHRREHGSHPSPLLFTRGNDLICWQNEPSRSRVAKLNGKSEIGLSSTMNIIRAITSRSI